MEKEIKIVKNPKELLQYLNLPDDFYCEKIPENVLGQLNKAKLKERSEIPTYLWSKNKYAETNCLEEIIQKYGNRRDLEEVNFGDMTLQQFREKYETKNKPCVIKGISNQFRKKYPFSWAQMLKDFGDKEMKIAESDSGKKIKIKLKHYFQYILHQTDDSPLYLFENCDQNKKIKKKYEVPSYFKEDYFNYVSQKDW